MQHDEADQRLARGLDTRALRLVETVVTEPGAHTLAFDAERDLVYAFLPETHRAAVYADRG